MERVINIALGRVGTSAGITLEKVLFKRINQ
jgi:hypothetical protein